MSRPTGDNKMNKSAPYSIKRSTTGKYHLSLGGSTAMCNGRTGKFASVHPVSVDHVPEAAFCEKCLGTQPKTMIANMRGNGSLE